MERRKITIVIMKEVRREALSEREELVRQKEEVKQGWGRIECKG